ncbi:Mpo1-like protein [Litoribacillus peritrichatus]|uniref:Mpo1-like protein n=1 Tax=Litoribacillus peritrichatus TaxID=718191 RepID=UPI0031DA0B16
MTRLHIITIKGQNVTSSQEFKSFAEFYPFYLGEHQNKTCRRLHVIGSLSVLGLIFFTLITKAFIWLFALPVIGYGFAWVGHFFFEKNRPATFQYPVYSFIGDWVMLKDVLTGKIKF